MDKKLLGGVTKPQGMREELVTYLLGLYTPLDPPEVEVIRGVVEEEEETVAAGKKRGSFVSGKQCF